MKKIYILLLVTTFLFSSSPLSANCNSASPSSLKTSWYWYDRPTCCNVVIDLLFSQVQNEVNHYYKDYLTQLPLVAPFMMELISIERTSEIGPEGYLVTVEANPYLGAHNSVGTDHITFGINLYGIQFIEFKHIKSEELMPKHQKYIIKPLP